MVSPLSLDLYHCCTRHSLCCCCNTWVGGSLRGRHCCTTFCCTAVSRWVDRFVAVTIMCISPVVSQSLRRLFYSFFFFPQLRRPRAGIFQRTTSSSKNGQAFRPRTDDLYDLYDLYDILPLHDLDISRQIDLSPISYTRCMICMICMI